MKFEPRGHGNMYNDPEYKERIAKLKLRLKKLTDNFSETDNEVRKIQSLIDADIEG